MLNTNNKECIHNYCHASTRNNDKEEAVQLIYLSKDVVSSQQHSTSVLLRISK